MKENELKCVDWNDTLKNIPSNFEWCCDFHETTHQETLYGLGTRNSKGEPIKFPKFLSIDCRDPKEPNLHYLLFMFYLSENYLKTVDDNILIATVNSVVELAIKNNHSIFPMVMFLTNNEH